MGRKRQGAAPSTLFRRVQALFAYGVKAFENSVFGPCTPHGTPGQVRRTWGILPKMVYSKAFSLISKYRFKTKEVISSG